MSPRTTAAVTLLVASTAAACGGTSHAPAATPIDHARAACTIGDQIAAARYDRWAALMPRLRHEAAQAAAGDERWEPVYQAALQVVIAHQKQLDETGDPFRVSMEEDAANGQMRTACADVPTG